MTKQLVLQEFVEYFFINELTHTVLQGEILEKLFESLDPRSSILDPRSSILDPWISIVSSKEDRVETVNLPLRSTVVFTIANTLLEDKTWHHWWQRLADRWHVHSAWLPHGCKSCSGIKTCTNCARTAAIYISIWSWWIDNERMLWKWISTWWSLLWRHVGNHQMYCEFSGIYLHLCDTKNPNLTRREETENTLLDKDKIIYESQ